MLTAGQVRLFMKSWKIRMYLSAVLCMWHSENSLSSQFLPASLFETGSVLFRACVHQASWTTSLRRLSCLCFPVAKKMHWNQRCLGQLCPAFIYVVSGAESQAPRLAGQKLQPLNHLRSLNNLLKGALKTDWQGFS